jgi:serine/threonine-protein kinase
VNGPPSLYHLVERMMALNPQQRYQTPSQLLDAIREVRREIESGTPAGKESGRVVVPATRSVFVVEKDERLQDTIRERLKELGYRVFLAGDPARALDRFQQQPYDALVVDAGVLGEEGLRGFDQVLKEAERRSLSCAGILILSEAQAELAKNVAQRPRTLTLVRPITLRQLCRALHQLIPLPAAKHKTEAQS